MLAPTQCPSHGPHLRTRPSHPIGPVYQSDADERLFRLAEHAQMLEIYGRFGGLLDADQYVARVREGTDQPLSVVARWIVDRDLVLICDRMSMEVPLFQFAPGTNERLPSVRAVIAELRDSHSDWDIALWFVSKNPHLQDQMPIELVRSNDSAVHAASRADRFAMMG